MFTSYIRYDHKAYELIEIKETRLPDCQFEFVVRLESRLFYDLTNVETLKVYDNRPEFDLRKVFELKGVRVKNASVSTSDNCITNLGAKIRARLLDIKTCMVIQINCHSYNVKHFEKHKIYKKLWLR